MINYRIGVPVLKTLLELLDKQSTLLQGIYRPPIGCYQFNDNLTIPVIIVPVGINSLDRQKNVIKMYHAPFHGPTATILFVQGTVKVVPTNDLIPDPPVGCSVRDIKEHDSSFSDTAREESSVRLKSTRRTPFTNDNCIILGL